MAPLQRDPDLDSVDNAVDTIDLTLSSPEPEPLPRMTPRQSQLPAFFKREPRPYSMTDIKNAHVRPAGSSKNVAPRQQPRPINPHHLAQLVNTSDSTALKEVLLHLCQLSPALSGAVARGLAPHSTFAQGLINQHGHPPRDTSAKRPVEDTHSIFERMKIRVAAKKGVTLKDPRLPGWVREAMQQQTMIKVAPSSPRGGSQHPHDRRSTPWAKREYSQGSSGSEYDNEHAQVPGAFPRSAQRVNSARTPLRDIPGSSSTAKHTIRAPSLSERPVSIRQKRKEAPRICAQCDESFTDENEVCMYHPGPKDEQGSIWSCCERAVGVVGCEFGGVHVYPEMTEAESPESRVRPESQITVCTQCHEPTGECGCSKHHPGRKVKRKDGMVVYSCCNNPISHRGCEDGPHVDPSRSYKRSSASPTPYTSQQKKPRIL